MRTIALLQSGTLAAGVLLGACSSGGASSKGASGGSGGASELDGAPGAGGGSIGGGQIVPDGGPGDAGFDGRVPLDGPGEPPACAPTMGGPHWLTEGDHLTVVPSCMTGLAQTPEAFVVDGAPPGFEYDPSNGTFEWSPQLDQAGVYELTVRVPSLGETGTVKIGVADRWEVPGNVAVDPATYTEEFGLPVFHLFTSDQLNEDEHTPARIVYRGREYRDTEAKYRGLTSLEFPKKSFTLKFSDLDRLSDVERGLVDERRVVLTTTFDDNSHLRQRLAYALWNRMDAAHIQIAASSVVVFKEGEYQGLYVVTDHVDADLMEDHGLFRDGNLYKARSHSANFRLEQANGSPKGALYAGYTKEEGTDLAADGGGPSYADLEALVRFVATSPDDEFWSTLDERIERTDFEDWFIFVTLIQANDSAGKNSYLYHDPRPDSPTPLFRYIPWDFNASFGQDWKTARVAPTVLPESYARYNHLFERFLSDPTASEALRSRYGALVGGEIAVDVVLALVDEWAAEVRSAALRDERKWDSAFREHDWHDRTDFTSHEEEVRYLRQFILDRWKFIDALY